MVDSQEHESVTTIETHLQVVIELLLSFLGLFPLLFPSCHLALESYYLIPLVVQLELRSL